jgi:hypothetical protein
MKKKYTTDNQFEFLYKEIELYEKQLERNFNWNEIKSATYENLKIFADALFRKVCSDESIISKFENDDKVEIVKIPYSEKFLDFEITNSGNGDGWSLCFDGCKVSSCETRIDAQRDAVLFFMLRRPKHFEQSMFQRAIGNGGTYLEWFSFKSVLKIENIELPEEVSYSECGNKFITCNGIKV